MTVIFLHPTDSGKYPAEVDPDITVQSCIENLVSDNFLTPASSDRPYEVILRRTGKQALPHMTMRQLGVTNKDALQILQSERGAS